MHVRTSIPIADLGCGSSAPIIGRELRRAPGVVEVYVNPATDTAYVRYDPALIDPRRLAAIIREAGYRPGPLDPA